MEFVDKIKDALAGHEDQVKDAVDKAGDFIDDKTDGQFAGQVDQVQDFLKGQLASDDAPSVAATDETVGEVLNARIAGEKAKLEGEA